jgi:hypothetical protein
MVSVVCVVDRNSRGRRDLFTIGDLIDDGTRNAMRTIMAWNLLDGATMSWCIQLAMPNSPRPCPCSSTYPQGE